MDLWTCRKRAFQNRVLSALGYEHRVGFCIEYIIIETDMIRRCKDEIEVFESFGQPESLYLGLAYLRNMPSAGQTLTSMESRNCGLPRVSTSAIAALPKLVLVAF